MSKIIQLEFKGVWWDDPDIWRDRYYKRDRVRPTETEALNNIYYEVMSLTGDYRTSLSQLDREVCDLDCLYKKRTYHKDTDRYTAIAQAYSAQYKVSMTAGDVRRILDDVSYVMRSLGYNMAIKAEVDRMKAEGVTLLPSAGNEAA